MLYHLGKFLCYSMPENKFTAPGVLYSERQFGKFPAYHHLIN